MKFVFCMLLCVSTAIDVFADEPQAEAKMGKLRKNILGVDLNIINTSDYSKAGINLNGRYVRDIHRYFDLATSLGYTFSYLRETIMDYDVVYQGGLSFLKYYPLVVCFTPFKKDGKVLQLGTGMGVYKAKYYKTNMGMTFQLNYLKRKKKFAWGFNVYADVIFARDYEGYRYRYRNAGVGFFFGGGF